jgi:cytochrome c5
MLFVVVAMAFASSTAFAENWDRCKVCHRAGGSPAPSKAQLLNKFNDEESFIRAALSTTTSMMQFVRTEEKLLRDVAKEIGVGVNKPLIEEEKAEEAAEPKSNIDAKKLIETKCTTCHNINRVVYAPNYTSGDWLHIVAKMETQQAGLLAADEMVAIVDYLFKHHDELKPVETTGEELQSANIPAETKEILVKSKCTVCHTGDGVLAEAASWTKEDWEHIIERMRGRAPELLKDVEPVQLASHLFDKFGGLQRSGVKKLSPVFENIYYSLTGNFQLWGEYQHAYDFNNNLDDDTQGPTSRPYNQGRAHDPRRVDGFYETRNLVSLDLMDGKYWHFRATGGIHALSDEGNQVLGESDRFYGDEVFRDEHRDNLETDLSVEELWFDVQFPYQITLRTGVQEYTSDFIGSIYKDTDAGVRLFATLPNGMELSLYGARRIEPDLVSRFNEFEDRNQEILIAHTVFKVGDVAFKPSIHYNNDDQGDKHRWRTGEHEDVEVVYLGNTTYGPDPFGLGTNILTGIYGVMGKQHNATVNGIDVRNILRLTNIEQGGLDHDPDQNVQAWSAYIDISKPLLDGMLTPHMGFFYASGDDNLGDDDATGFDSISDDVNVWGDRGIIIDDRQSLRVRGLETPQSALGNHNLIGLLSNRKNPLMPGRRLIAPKSSSVTVVRENSPYVSLRDIDASSNFINPGVMAFNFGTGFAPLEWLTGNLNFTYFWFEDEHVIETLTDVLSPFNDPPPAGINSNSRLGDSNWNPGSGSAKSNSLNRDLGYEISADMNFAVHKYVTIFTGAAMFVPNGDENFEKLWGDSDVATNLSLGLQVKF